MVLEYQCLLISTNGSRKRELSQLILVDLKFSRFTVKRIRALALYLCRATTMRRDLIIKYK